MIFRYTTRRNVRTGHRPWFGLHSRFALLFVPILALIFFWHFGQSEGATADSPAPLSPVITNLEWAPAASIRRAAGDSDNWPITWADDGNLYTAYGDGVGFPNPPSQRRSMGFASVAGGPTDFTGTNIPSPDSQFGDGRTGKKASGMLMVDGVLYMWVRNANNAGEQCQLAHSADYAENWTWSSWTFAEFGYCTFINYGQNYAGARDSYVYMVSHDYPDAYVGTQDFILTRVSKDKIMERAEYEFFVGLDDGNQPVWSDDIEQRGPVFSYSDNRARRSGISYNAAIGRYLWWHGFPGAEDERYAGGFGVYDAPEPWGPWTTVYYTDAWDVGPGETASFPTKWMSGDGTELYLVFSGDDAFSVRKATLTLNNAPTSTPTPRTGPVTDTPEPTVPVEPQTLQVRVASGDDDVEEQDGNVNFGSGDLEMVENQDRPQWVGIRFRQVAIPAGATITRAVLQFTSDGAESKATSLTLHGEASDDAAPFTAGNGPARRSRTNAGVSWDDVSAWSRGEVVESPELSAIVQEIVDQSGWRSGNDMVFTVSGSGKRAATSYNGSAGNAPLLIVEFSTGGGDGEPTPTDTPVVDEPTPTDTPEVVEPTPTETPEVIEPTPTPQATVPVEPQTLQVRVSSGDDDVEEQDGKVDFGSGDLEMVENQSRPQWVGIRFRQVAIPAGATITRAVLQLTSDRAESKATSLTLHGEASDDAVPFAAGNGPSSRIRTNAGVSWPDVSAWSRGEVVESPDLSAIVQEIVDRSGWSSGNALVFTVSGSGKRAATSYNGSAGNAPLLIVEFSTTGGGGEPTPTNTPEVIEPTPTDTPIVVEPTPTPTPQSTVPAESQTLRVRVTSGVDDVEEQDGNVDFGSGDLEMVENRSRPQWVGIRFRQVAIPAGATVTRAVLQFTSDGAEGKATSLTLHGEASDDAAPFAPGDGPSSRSRTNASVSWPNVPAWSRGEVVESPDLSAIVQEIVDRGGWRSGNDMVFTVSGSGKRAATSYNGSASDAPLLIVEFSTAGGTANAAHAGALMREIFLPAIVR